MDIVYYGTSGLPTGKLYGVPTEPLHPFLVRHILYYTKNPSENP